MVNRGEREGVQKEMEKERGDMKEKRVRFTLLWERWKGMKAGREMECEEQAWGRSSW